MVTHEPVRARLQNVSHESRIERCNYNSDVDFSGLYREVPGSRIPGGSEDVMLDLSVRQLVKNYKNKTKELERPKGSSKL